MTFVLVLNWAKIKAKRNSQNKVWNLVRQLGNTISIKREKQKSTVTQVGDLKSNQLLNKIILLTEKFIERAYKVCFHVLKLYLIIDRYIPLKCSAFGFRSGYAKVRNPNSPGAAILQHSEFWFRFHMVECYAPFFSSLWGTNHMLVNCTLDRVMFR